MDLATFRLAGNPQRHSSPSKEIGGIVLQKVEGNGSSPREKQDVAVTRWRKWASEQQIQNPASSSQTRPRRLSPGIPLVTVSSSSRNAQTSSRQSLRSFNNEAQSPRDYDESLRFSSDAGSPLQLDDFETLNTVSIMALRDVELAIDEDILERSKQAKVVPRRMSNRPRLAEAPNPFVNIAQRLGSRRVRPFVIELVHALGYFIDAVWTLTYPHDPCPWIINDGNFDQLPNMPQGMQVGPSYWKSLMLTAVQEGKHAGHVPILPTAEDVEFWQEEVGFAMLDVDEVVGIQKRVRHAFARAVRLGQYGKLDKENVVGLAKEGGGVARLLNDLEEALWGYAPPRPTDLAYELPDDFDPYAIYEEPDPAVAACTGFSLHSDHVPSNVIGKLAVTNSSIDGSKRDEKEAHSVLPDLKVLVTSSENNYSENGRETAIDLASRSRIQALFPDLEIIPQGAEDMTLKELGRRRYQEWLASRAAVTP
ncbi:uncharacterized protein L203_100366 [Cryptococcus depauperatus CBS 7841]|uniref:Uncharacterized protein n=1 Tax=Cryptococcus depauperatus CBS 7841 TaxID=1295531 RepID=A0AAJ8JN18_9TREE